MHTPAAEVPITVELVQDLLLDQHPDLAGLPVVPRAGGWDNTVFALGDRLCVRLPRREASSALVLNEQRLLGEVSERVGVPVPVPFRTGRPGRGYPWHWSVNPWFEGRSAAEIPPSDRGPLVEPLAAFLTRMHVPAPDDAPLNPVRGVPLASRHDRVIERLGSGLVPRSDELLSLWERLVTTPGREGPPLWLHGDLHPANVLVTAGGDPGLAAVLDFGDMTAGDPATDLAVAWLMFEAPDRARLRSLLNRPSEADDATWDRARAWAVIMASAIATGSDDNAVIAAVGDHAVNQVLLPDHP